MNDCPNCELGHVKDGVCPRCEWVAPKVRAVDSRPDWMPPDYRPPTPEEQAEIRQLIEQTAAALDTKALERGERKPLAHLPKRCPKCDVGNFVHRGIRYCLDGYLGRHQS